MIQLQLRPEAKAELIAAATEHGQTPEEYAATLIEQQVAPPATPYAEVTPATYHNLPQEQWIEKFNEWIASIPPRDGPPLSDRAVSRDSIYD